MEQRRVSELFALFFDPRVPVTFIIGSIVLAILGNAAYALLVLVTGEQPQTLVAIVVAALLIFVFIIFGSWAWLRRQPRRTVTMSEELRARPHAGLVLCVSDPQHARAAIAFHRNGGALRACWLITSPESQARANELAEWARGLGLRITLLPVDDAFASHQSYLAVKDALHQARRTRDSQPVIVDITGGPKPMTAGAVLACFEHDAPIQYMRTLYEDGRPVISAEPQAMKVEAL